MFCFTADFGATAFASADPGLVYYSTDDFEVTDFDLKMYLRGSPPNEEGTVGSPARNLQAISDLYALRALRREVEASDSSLLSEVERQWIAEYAITIEMVNRYIAREVESQLAETDWESEAQEKYWSNPKVYETPESVSVRTLLIRIGELSEDEAMTLAASLLDEAKAPGADFAEIVRLNSQDEVGKKKGGLMKDIQRGMTVKAFESAAFALRRPGQFSEPVVSQYGVHLIQLVEYKQPSIPAFEDVKEQIVEELKPIRAAEYRQAIQDEARFKKVPGYVEHTEALDELMSQTAGGSPGVR